jgi:hypothetical protein
MNVEEHRHLEVALTERCGRAVNVSEGEQGVLHIVLEPVGDRGRTDIAASFANGAWSLNDRGVNARHLSAEFDFILAKLDEIGSPLMREGDTIVDVANDVSFVESVAHFVDSLEFIPVLAGLWSNSRLSAVA